MAPKKWARAKQSGMHGLRRGAWYQVVNDPEGNLVVLSVRKDNVPVPRGMVTFSDTPPTEWSVVQWSETQTGARRASERNLRTTYGVCPKCGNRQDFDPPNAPRMACGLCHETFGVDWEHPC